ncbi:MAG: Holliday junction branch migration protein RuvA [Candidatus Dasytiphilus stammeri]
MIGHLRGVIIDKYPPQILLEVNGIGYEISMPMTCFYLLPELKCETNIVVHFVVRKDAQLLFGFNNKQERTLFRELIKVNGIGPKLALAILSGMSATQFISAIESKQISSLVRLPGVGKKIAERLVVEMKDRLKDKYSNFFSCKNNDTSIKNTRARDAEEEAISALVVLGYKPQEASRMIRNINNHIKSAADCETLIREALRAAL